MSYRRSLVIADGHRRWLSAIIIMADDLSAILMVHCRCLLQSTVRSRLRLNFGCAWGCAKHRAFLMLQSIIFVLQFAHLETGILSCLLSGLLDSAWAHESPLGAPLAVGIGALPLGGREACLEGLGAGPHLAG